MYVVGAPFDAEDGTLTGPLRQITLDAIQVQPRHIPRVSPDGAWLAYVECCSTGALRIIPIAGGNPRTLYTPKSTHPRATPFSIGWAPDGRAVLFQIEDAGAFARMRVSTEGGTQTMLGKSEVPISRPLEDGKTWVVYESEGDRQHSYLRLPARDMIRAGRAPFGSGAAGRPCLHKAFSVEWATESPLT
jgi:Tol biopolymer transport system component